jgi:hypothetical protein
MHQSISRYASLSLSYLLRPLSEEPEEEQQEPESSLFLLDLSGDEFESYSKEQVRRLVGMKRQSD